jgi:putative component of toxin-antitoxin plasmid stabilization module
LKEEDTHPEDGDIAWRTERLIPFRSGIQKELSLTSRIRDREAKPIWKLRDALERLEEGTLGICEKCGEGISVKEAHGPGGNHFVY